MSNLDLPHDEATTQSRLRSDESHKTAPNYFLVNDLAQQKILCQTRPSAPSVPAGASTQMSKGNSGEPLQDGRRLDSARISGKIGGFLL